MSFRQALGRVVRTNGPDDDSHAYIVMPILKSLDEYAKRVEKEMPPKFTKEKIIKRKKCPECYKECDLNATSCSECGHQFSTNKSFGPSFVTCGNCGEKNSSHSKNCFNCGESLEPSFNITLSEALRDGAISRGIELNEDEVKEGEEIFNQKRDLIFQSGDEVLIEMMRKLPPEALARFNKIINNQSKNK